MTMTDDTNRRVAEACGLSCRIETYKLGSFLATEVDGHWYFFIPSDVADHAVIAAEKFGLFQDRNCCVTQINGQWVVMRGETILGSGTFCEAICQSVLKLHESNSST